MLRKLVAVLTMAVMGMLAVPALASASNPRYQAPSVTPGPVDPAAVASTPVDLASTGAGFSLGAAIAIGVAVLLVGIALLAVGNRLRRTSSR